MKRIFKYLIVVSILRIIVAVGFASGHGWLILGVLVGFCLVLGAIALLLDVFFDNDYY